MACLQGQNHRAGYLFCSFKHANPNGGDALIPKIVLGQLSGPIPPPGAQFSLFGPPVTRSLLRKSLGFGVQKKDTVGSTILRPPLLGLACLKEQKSAPPFHIGLGSLPTLAVEAAKSQSPRCLFSGPRNKVISQKTYSNKRSDK